MKSISSILTFLFISAFIISCSQYESSDFYGTWEVSSIEIENTELENHHLNGLKSELKSMVIDLNEDGLILHSDFFRLGANGTWNLDIENQKLKCKYEYERAVYNDDYKITSKKPNSMTLKSTDFEGVDAVNIHFIRK